MPGARNAVATLAPLDTIQSDMDSDVARQAEAEKSRSTRHFGDGDWTMRLSSYLAAEPLSRWVRLFLG